MRILIEAIFFNEEPTNIWETKHIDRGEIIVDGRKIWFERAPTSGWPFEHPPEGVFWMVLYYKDRAAKSRIEVQTLSGQRILSQEPLIERVVKFVLKKQIEKNALVFATSN